MGLACSSVVAGSWPNNVEIHLSNPVVTYGAGRTRSVKLRLAFGTVTFTAMGEVVAAEADR